MIGFAEEGRAANSDEADFTARAIGIGAALGAEAASVVVVTAEEAVTAIELGAVVGGYDST